MGFGIILLTEYVDCDGSDLKVIYLTGKYNHGGGNQNLYSSETGPFCCEDRIYRTSRIPNNIPYYDMIK